jgi:hypothetical protein
MFQLTREEFDSLRSQIAMSNAENSSQNAMSKTGRVAGALCKLIASCDIKMPAAAGVGRGLTPLLSTARWLSCIRHDDPRENIGAPRRV